MAITNGKNKKNINPDNNDIEYNNIVKRNSGEKKSQRSNMNIDKDTLDKLKAWKMLGVVDYYKEAVDRNNEIAVKQLSPEDRKKYYQTLDDIKRIDRINKKYNK